MILDCTFRDGGYYVKWDFDEKTVQKYVSAVTAAKIDIIEIGFRFLSTKGFMGAFAYSTDDYLRTLSLPESSKIAVMVNADELLNSEIGAESAVDTLFENKAESVVDIVRIAVHAKDVDASYSIAKRLNELGYRVFVNLMQIDLIDEQTLGELAECIACWNLVDVLYFADSFGSMEPVKVQRIVDVLQGHWRGDIGIHAHDNKGIALQNSLAAIEAGVEYVDATISGMGRGAGNTKTEYLLVELMHRGKGGYFPDAIFPLVVQDFKKLQEEHQWGPSIYYYLAAINSIHPSYIQQMLDDERYDLDHMLAAINFLQSTSSSFFSIEKMLRAVVGIEGDERGDWSAANWLKGKTVLIIGAGPSVSKYLNAIKVFIAKYNPFVLCLNINDRFPTELVDAYVACHEMRILMEFDQYTKLGRPIILPLSRLPEGVKDALSGLEVLDYGLRIDHQNLSISEEGCKLPSPLALFYALAVSTAGGAKKILMTGVDGWDEGDTRQKEMIDVLERYCQQPEAVSLEAITPTKFPLRTVSLFAKQHTK